MRKRTILPLKKTKTEFVMILKHNKVKLENEDTATRSKPDSISGIYLTDVKLAQYRQVDKNRREKEEAKKVTAKKISTRKVHLQLKRSEVFDRCIKYMNSLSSSTTDEEKLIQIIQKQSYTINDAFVHIGGKFSELTNQRRDTAAREMI